MDIELNNLFDGPTTITRNVCDSGSDFASDADKIMVFLRTKIPSGTYNELVRKLGLREDPGTIIKLRGEITKLEAKLSTIRDLIARGA